MSILENAITGQRVVLRVNHTVGRSQSSLLIINEVDVSKSHARIRWDGQCWLLTDTSRNGTLLNDKIILHASIRLKAGDMIQFSESVRTTWKMLDEQKPVNYILARSEEFKLIRLTESPLVYPNTITPEVSFSRSASLKWFLEINQYTMCLEHGNAYRFAGLFWTFYENEPLIDTIDLPNVNESGRMEFYLSSDEESVEVKIVINDLVMTMGEKVYHFFLLLLARKRLEDQKRNLPKSDQGWLYVEVLLSLLSKELQREVDVYYLNVMIHRFRHHVSQLKPYGYLFANVIERRKGKLRLNGISVHIHNAEI